MTVCVHCALLYAWQQGSALRKRAKSVVDAVLIVPAPPSVLWLACTTGSSLGPHCKKVHFHVTQRPFSSRVKMMMSS